MASRYHDLFGPLAPSRHDQGLEDQKENSWYCHSFQTGDQSFVTSPSPVSDDPRTVPQLGSNPSSLDPRRITPTLHASLVSEILALRRELENKNAFIDDLETNLQSSKLEVASVTTRLDQSLREARTSKKLSDDAEKHMHEVTEGLVKERDEAIAVGKDLRDKLNKLATRSHRQEQDFENWQREWERERDLWSNEKRGLELRLHTTETHLRSVVEGVNSARARREANRQKSSIDSGLGNDSPVATPTTPVTRHPRHGRNMSSISFQNDTFFVETPPRDLTADCGPGRSLADELNQDDPADDDQLNLHHANGSNDASQQQNISHHFVESPTKGSKVHGLDFATAVDNLSRPDQAVVPKDTELTPEDHFAAWVEPRIEKATATPPLSRTYSSTQTQTDLVPFPGRKTAQVIDGADVSLPVQDLDGQQLPSTERLPSLQPVASRALHYHDAATQFDPVACPDLRFLPRVPTSEAEPSTIPHIAVHPPSSLPHSPRSSTVLPPNTTNASTQTDRASDPKSVDVEVQTEEIRIDLKKFHAHLQHHELVKDTSNDDRPLSYEIQLSQATDQSAPVKEIETNLAAQAIRDTAHRSGLADSPHLPGERSVLPSGFWGAQPARSSNVLASLRNEPGIGSGQSSALAEGLRTTRGQDQSWPRDNSSARTRATNPDGTWLNQPSATSITRDSITMGMRTSFRSRASSVDTADSSIFSTVSQPPPLPVPNRSSSRFHADIVEESGAESGQDGSPKPRAGSHASSRPTGIRKARSATVGTQDLETPLKRRRHVATRLAPIHSVAWDDTNDELGDQPMPDQDPHWPLGPPDPQVTPAFDEIADGPLVDAIASAMVGEWMWKYAQKRRSFGVIDGARDYASEGKDASRKRRWVWISPYERTIMWSTKQPTSGSQLLGSRGRRLTIKTVLDIADNSALPRGAKYGTCFDRSIVILTTARPLKITAPNKKRHYYWLTALSFLANPSQGVNIPRIPKGNRAGISTLDLRPGHFRSETQEHKEGVFNASISKASVSKPGPAGYRNFSAPASSLPFLSLSASMEDVRQMLRRDSSASWDHTSCIYSNDAIVNGRPLERRDSPNERCDLSHEDTFALRSQQPHASRTPIYDAEVRSTNTRRRAATNPLRIVTNLTGQNAPAAKPSKTTRSLYPSPSAPAFSPITPQLQMKPSTLRVAAFVDKPSPSSPVEFTSSLDRRPFAPLDSHPARTLRSSLPPLRIPSEGARSPLLNPAFPGFERRDGKATPSPLPSPGEDFERYAKGERPVPDRETPHTIGLSLSSLGNETSIQAGTSVLRRSFHPNSGALGHESNINHEGSDIGRSSARPGSRGGVKAVLKPNAVGAALATGLRKKKFSSGVGGAASPSPSGAGDGGSVLSLRSDATKGTEEKKRLGYVFDDQGRDPFRGF